MIIGKRSFEFHQKLTFALFLVGYIGYYFCRKNLSAAVPLIGAEFNFTNSQLGLIALYSELAYAFGKFINGPLGDRIGGRKIFLIGMIGAIVCNFIFSFGSNLIFFIIVWCICRYFLSMGWGGLAKTMGNWFPSSQNGTVMGFISISFQFGGVLTSLLCGLIIGLGYSWKYLFIFPPIIVCFIFLGLYILSRDLPSELGFENIDNDTVLENSEEGFPLKKLFKLSMFRWLLVYSFLTTFLRSIFFFWTPKLLVDLGMGTQNAVLKSAIFPLLGCLGTIFLGWYTDNYAKDGKRTTMMWIMLLGLTVCLFSIGAGIGMDSVPPNVIVILLGAAGFFLLGPYSMSSGCLTLDIAGAKAAGSCTGMIDGLGYIGGALAVWSAGALSDSLGWAEVFYVLTVFSLLAVVCCLAMGRAYDSK